MNLRNDNLKCWSSGPDEQALPRASWMSRPPPADLTSGHEGISPHMKNSSRRTEGENSRIGVRVMNVCVCGHQRCSS